MKKIIGLAVILVMMGAGAAGAQTLEDIRETHSPVTIDDIILALPANLPNSRQFSASGLSSSVDNIVDSADFTRLFSFGLDNGFYNLKDNPPTTCFNFNMFIFNALFNHMATKDISEYRKYDLSRRFCGSITFGGRRNSKNLTDIFAEMEDIVSIQLKCRMVGSRDRLDNYWKNEYDPRFSGSLGREKQDLCGDPEAYGKMKQDLEPVNDRIDGSFLLTLVLGGEWRRYGQGDPTLHALLITQKSILKNLDFAANLGYIVSGYDKNNAAATIDAGVKLSGKLHTRGKHQVELAVSCAGRWGAQQTVRAQLEVILPVTPNFNISLSTDINYDAHAPIEKQNVLSSNMGLTYNSPGFEK